MTGISSVNSFVLPSRSGDRTLEAAVSKAIVISGNCFFNSKRHDELLRCNTCKMKFDIHRLTYVDIGVYYCKFCSESVAGGVA